MRYFKSVVALGAVIGAMSLASSAQAQFASFTLTSPAKALYTDAAGVNTARLSLATINGTTATPLTSAFADFTYLVPNGATATVPTTISANITFTASSTSNVSNTGTQTFQNVSIQFTNAQTFTARSGTIYAAGTANLLTLTVAPVTGVTGTLSGINTGSTSATLFGSQASGNIVGYTSDFLDFGAGNQSYIATISNARDLASNTAGIVRQGANARDFYGDLSGSFSANALDPTPAPPGVVSALIGIGMGGAQFGLVRFRRRRAKKTEATEASEATA